MTIPTTGARLPFGVRAGESYDPSLYDENGLDRHAPFLHLAMLRGKERLEAQQLLAQQRVRATS